MSLKTDIARDWQIFDGVEDVTLTGKSDRSEVSEVSVTGVKALQRQITRSNSKAFGDVLTDPGDVLFEIWDYRASGSTNVTTALGRQVRPGDTITQTDGTIWWIRQAVWSPLTSRWQTRCNRDVNQQP